MNRIREKRSSSVLSKNADTRSKKTQDTKNSSASKKTSSFADHLKLEVQPQHGEGISILLADGTFDIAVIQEMQDSIHQIGEILIQNPRIDTAMEYKNAVQKLLQSIIPHIHTKETHTVKKGIMTPHGPDFIEHKFTIVAKIHKKLDNVLKLILGTQGDQMKLMESLDEIKGLIVDLLQ